MISFSVNSPPIHIGLPYAPVPFDNIVGTVLIDAGVCEVITVEVEEQTNMSNKTTIGDFEPFSIYTEAKSGDLLIVQGKQKIRIPANQVPVLLADFRERLMRVDKRVRDKLRAAESLGGDDVWARINKFAEIVDDKQRSIYRDPNIVDDNIPNVNFKKP
jgi:hypothetical protein